MTRSRSTIWFILMTVVVCSSLFLIGCESKSVADDGNTASAVVSVNATPGTIESGTTSIVVATVTAGGSAVANQPVIFSVSPVGAGNFSSSTGTTDAAGELSVVFNATTVGTATISCSIDGGTTFSTTIMNITSTAQSGSGNVVMSVTSTLLLANGIDTSRVTIVVQDANGQPAPDLTLVKIVAGEKFIDVDGNGYWSQGIDTLVYDANENGQWDAYGLVPSSAFTAGGTGSITVDYVSGNVAATSYIRATVADNGITGAVETAIQITPNAQINSIFLSSDSLNLVVKGTGGIETANLSAIGFDEFGNIVPEGLPIVFTILDNPYHSSFPGGDSAHLANVAPDAQFSALTNSQGVATCPISAGMYAGTVRIQASANGQTSNTTQVMVSAGPPAYIVSWVEDCNVPNWNTAGVENGIGAIVSDVYLNTVGNNVVVYFSTDEGTMKSHENATENFDGQVATHWISGNNVGTADGYVMVVAETSGGTVADTSFFFNSGLTASLISSDMPDSIDADGTSKTQVTIFGYDVNGNPVDDGSGFDVYSQYLSVSGGTFDNTNCASSFAHVEIKSIVLDVDNSMTGGNDDGIGAVDPVRFYDGLASTTYNVTIYTGVANRGKSEMTVEPTSVPASGSINNIEVIIKDFYGNPLGDHTLVMTASGGTVSGGSQNTNKHGIANGFNWTAPVATGDYVLTISDSDPRGGGVVLTTTVTVE